MAQPSPIEKPEVRGRILAATRAGATRGDAARQAGVGESTFRRWLAVGAHDDREDVESLHRELRDRVRRAEAEARAQAVAALRHTMLDDARWTLEYLQRRARNDRIEAAG